MAITFPKQVEIVNWRLDLFQSALTLVAAVLLALRFIISNQYSKFVPVADLIDVVTWSTGWETPAAVQQVVDQNRDTLYCQDPFFYDYRWDKENTYDINNVTCIPLCERGTMSRGCLHNHEISVIEPGSVFLGTFLSDSYLDNEGGSNNIQHYWVPTIEALSVEFIYSYKIPEEGFIQLGTPGSDSSNDDAVEHSCMTDTLTVILDSKGDQWKAIRPPLTAIRLTARELFMLAGHENALDLPNKYAGRNYAPNKENEAGPIGRLSGLQINLKVECYNYHPIPFDDDWDDDHVCYVKVQLSSRGWTRIRKVEAYNSKGESRNRAMYGVRVKMITGGHFQYPDSNNILLNATSALVLLGLVRSLMLFVAVTLLGHVSTIYKRVIYERFHITEQLGGMATRLMANSVAYVELEDKQRGSGGEGLISRERMSERLSQVMSHRKETLDPEEVEAFVTLCFLSVVSQGFRDEEVKSDGWALALDDQIAGLSSFKAVVSRMMNEKEEGPQLPRDIDIDNFSRACASQDKISFDDMTLLFDRDRPLRILERFFFPADFQLAMDASLKLTPGHFPKGTDHLGTRNLQRHSHSDEGDDDMNAFPQAQSVSAALSLDTNASDTLEIKTSPSSRHSVTSLSLEKRKRWFWDTLEQVEGLATREKARQAQVQEYRATVKDMGERMRSIEDYLEGAVEEKITSLEKALVPMEEQQELNRKVEGHVLRLEQENLELKNRVRRLDDMRAAVHREDRAAIKLLEQRLLILEQATCPASALATPRANAEDAPGEENLHGMRPASALPSDVPSEVCGPGAMRQCFERRKYQV